MNNCHIPKQLMQNHPLGKRKLGRSKKRWNALIHEVDDDDEKC